LLVPDLIVAEVVYVLESFYEVKRQCVAGVDRLDFAEAYLVASAEADGVETIASLDRTIDRLATIQRHEPS
jgi:predicted nucleic-acid-binding protein